MASYELIRPGEFWGAVKGWPELYEYLPIDTESNEGKPYSIQFSTAPGNGFMFLVEDKTSLQNFSCFFDWDYDSRAVMHNAVYDLDELDQVGVYVKSHRDTMQELYHLGNQPQGLKAAVYRILGHRMTSYDEVVTPYSKFILEEWLSDALAHASTSMRTLHCEQLKTKVRETWKPHESETVLRRIMGKLGDDYDPWTEPKIEKGIEKPRLIGRPWLKEIEGKVGRLPRKSIVHAPIEQQVAYGCSDADWTGRLATWLEGERKRIVTEEWSLA